MMAEWDWADWMFLAFATLAGVGAVLLCKELRGRLASPMVTHHVSTQTEFQTRGAGTRSPEYEREQQQQQYEGCYHAYTVKRLRDICRERGCHVSGIREDLVQRLLRNDDHMRDSAFRET